MVGWVARALYNEPYITMPMRQSVDESRALYQLQIDGQWQGLGVRTAGAWRDQDEAELFITEHYWGIIRREMVMLWSIRLSIQRGAPVPSSWTVWIWISRSYMVRNGQRRWAQSRTQWSLRRGQE